MAIKLRTMKTTFFKNLLLVEKNKFQKIQESYLQGGLNPLEG